MKKSRNFSKSHKLSRKPNRTKRIKRKRVLSTGEHSDHRLQSNGKLRHYDLRGRSEKDDCIPRKAREFMASMTRWNLNPSNRVNQSDLTLPQQALKKTEKPEMDNRTSKRRTRENTGLTSITTAIPRSIVHHSSTNNDVSEKMSKIPTSRKRFDGMTSGESLPEYSARLKKESQRMAIDITKKGKHQTEKRKAYNKRRRERVERRKKRRRGELSDSDVEHGPEYDENVQNISHLPAYWQEIIDNNGRPVSSKRKKRIRRLEEAKLKHNFGDQVDRPPNLTVYPVSRSRDATIHST